MISVRIEGAEAVREKLNSLALAVRQEVLTEALHAGAEPILETAKDNAPEGDIQDALQIVNTQAERDSVTVEVGIPGGRHRGFYGLWYELGTGPRQQKSTKRDVGQMPARPFLRPAFDTRQEDAQARIAAVIRRELEALTRG